MTTSDSEQLEEQLAEAARLCDGGDPGAAFDLLLRLEQNHPDDPTLLCMLGVVAAEADAAGMSYDYFRRCLALQPEDPYVLATLGSGLARYDDPDAESVLRLAAITAPELPVARLRYGAYLAREGLLDMAIDELEAAAALDPGDPEPKREIAIAQLLAGAPDRALPALEAAIALTDGDPELEFLLGLTLIGTGDLPAAGEALHHASLALTDDAEVQLTSAVACASLAWSDEAWNALARAEAAFPPADATLAQEVEELIEGAPEAARNFLTSQLVPTVLRERILARS